VSSLKYDGDLIIMGIAYFGTTSYSTTDPSSQNSACDIAKILGEGEGVIEECSSREIYTFIHFEFEGHQITL
jgi:hypothetical protein